MTRRYAAIVHPEGNLNDNPNLTGIVELLVERGWRVAVLSPRRAFPQKTPCAGADLILFDRPDLHGCFLFSAAGELDPAAAASMAGADLVIGVDRGIIDASRVARRLQVPCGLISYEITFASEAGSAFKAPEIAACQGVAFAIVQDAVRGGELARENRIPLERLFYVPVAGAGSYPPPPDRPRLFHRRLGLGDQARVALYMGSVAAWAQCDALLASVVHWPADWHLVIHSRRRIDTATRAILRSAPHAPDRIHVSTEPFETPAAMRDFIHSADLGIAFYRPTFTHYNLGRNIQLIGMASGKTATYLQHGLPVAVTPSGEMSDHVQRERLGMVVEDPARFVPDDSVLGAGERCLAFFREHLDLRRTLTAWLDHLSRIAGDRPAPGGSEGVQTPAAPGTSETGPAAWAKEIARVAWFHRIHLGGGIVTPGRDDSAGKLEQLGLDVDLKGMRVLDIGAWDGFFSFEAERRGAAEVVAADIVLQPGLRLAKRILGSAVKPLAIDILELSPERVGRFDLVLCLGVLYHLKHPLLALERVFSVTAGKLILETHVDMLDCPRPAMAFYPADELNGDPSNWCGPNPAMVIAMLRTAGFRHVEMHAHTLSGGYAENRAVFHAWR